jgi:hypothetical protein
LFCAYLRVYATRDLFLLGLEEIHGWRWDGNPGLGLTALGSAHYLFGMDIATISLHRT